MWMRSNNIKTPDYECASMGRGWWGIYFKEVTERDIDTVKKIYARVLMRKQSLL